ncbi:MAG: hypothetical protein MUQ56_06275 [Thermoleophilia bacterium]|nr:hypothetical protein [Thermoleophilia bacterium]
MASPGGGPGGGVVDIKVHMSAWRVNHSLGDCEMASPAHPACSAVWEIGICGKTFRVCDYHRHLLALFLSRTEDDLRPKIAQIVAKVAEAERMGGGFRLYFETATTELVELLSGALDEKQGPA